MLYKLFDCFYHKLSALFLIVFLLASVNSFAVTITVDTADDVISIADAKCSLREALINANTDPTPIFVFTGECDVGSGPDDIVFDSSLDGTPIILGIAGTAEDAAATGDLDINSDITIIGNGPENTIIDGGGIDRVIHILSGNAVLEGVTIQNGSSGEVGGGIYNQGSLVLDSSVVKDNEANAGGGIYSLGGNMSVARSTITNNITLDSGFTNPQGAGVYNNGGTASIIESSITNNQTASTGSREAGGIRNVGTLFVFNSTISGNSASAGGGIRNQNGNTTLGNVTITNNTGGGISHFTFTGTDQVVLENTIVAGNNTAVDSDCGGDPVTSNGNNLDSDNTCNFTDPSDIQNTDPMLGPLADNGGETQTHLLLAGSPAIDAGGICLVTDQRGTISPQDGDDDGTAICDIGAVEMLLSELISSGGSSGSSGCSLIYSDNYPLSSAINLLIPILSIFGVFLLRRENK